MSYYGNYSTENSTGYDSAFDTSSQNQDEWDITLDDNEAEGEIIDQIMQQMGLDPSNTEQRQQIVSAINQRLANFLENGGNPEDLVTEVENIINDVKAVTESQGGNGTGGNGGNGDNFQAVLDAINGQNSGVGPLQGQGILGDDEDIEAENQVLQDLGYNFQQKQIQDQNGNQKTVFEWTDPQTGNKILFEMDEEGNLWKLSETGERQGRVEDDPELSGLKQEFEAAQQELATIVNDHGGDMEAYKASQNPPNEEEENTV